MEVSNNVKKKDNFLIYAIIVGLLAVIVLLGPAVFIVLGTHTVINADGKPTNPWETQYILSVCIASLIVCGILLILSIYSLIYKIVNKKKKAEN